MSLVSMPQEVDDLLRLIEDPNDPVYLPPANRQEIVATVTGPVQGIDMWMYFVSLCSPRQLELRPSMWCITICTMIMASALRSMQN